MDPDTSISITIKHLANQLTRYLTTQAMLGQKMIKLGEFTEVQGHIIHFLAEHMHEDVYQKDIEKYLNIRRSTATVILQRMEKAGMLTREVCSDDGRMKKLILTAKSKELHPQAKAELLNAEAQARKGISPEDLAVFFEVVEKITSNIS